MKIISNSSALIALANINRFYLLHELFGTIYIPVEVEHEVFKNTIEKPDFIKVCKVKNALAVKILNQSLGIGESAVIVLSQEIHSDLVILDDLKARKIAENAGIAITGLIGVLLAAKKNKIVPSLRPIIVELQQVGFRISDKIIKSILE